jgi:metal-sulfur cluster biosynthetic enzyme
MSDSTIPPQTASAAPESGAPQKPPKITWAADSSHPEKATKLREMWADVVDPELGLNIIQLGLIREVDVQADRAQVRMILTTPFCPYAPAMIDATRRKAEEALGTPVLVELGAEVWNPAMMDEDAAADWGLLY